MNGTPNMEGGPLVGNGGDERETFLIVGGPADGRRVAVPHRPDGYPPHVLNVPCEYREDGKFEYFARFMIVGARTFIYYAPPRWDDCDVLHHLLDRYGLVKPEEGRG